MKKLLFLLPLILALLVSGTVEAKKKKYPNGDYYEGEWKKGQPNGFGKMIYANGDVYEGNWVLGKMEGQGVMTNQRENITYNGTWKNGLPNGNGTMYMKNFTYEGLWNEGKILEGKVTDPKRNVFEGTFLDGKTVKTGKMTYSNGNWCEGDWENNKLLNGKCKSVISDSLYFEGEVKNGLPFAGIGKGRIAKNYYDGKWENGEFTGHCILKECTDKISLFEGERKSDGCYNGKLKFEGGTYVGEVDSVFTKQGEGELHMDQYNCSLNGIWSNDYLTTGKGTLKLNNQTYNLNITHNTIEVINNDEKLLEVSLTSNATIPVLFDNIANSIISKIEEVEKKKNEREYCNKIFYCTVPLSKFSDVFKTPLFGDMLNSKFDKNIHIIVRIALLNNRELIYTQQATMKGDFNSYNRGYLLQQINLAKDWNSNDIYYYSIQDGYLIFKSNNKFVGEQKFKIINDWQSLLSESNNLSLKLCTAEQLNKLLPIIENEELEVTPKEQFEKSPANEQYATFSPNMPPKFYGGDSELSKYMGSNMKYPEVSQNNGIQGRVVVEFVVTRTGDIKNVKVTRKVDAYLDAEAIRVVKSMPKWHSGIYNGQFVDMKMSLPLTFKLN